MNTNSVIVVGLNHLKAGVGRRERVAVSQEELGEALAGLRNEARLREIVILSTCSRVEVYGVSEDPVAAMEAVQSWFDRRSGGGLANSLYALRGPQAVRHLFRVAGGLDSWILGESEILGQVKRAYQAALDLGFTGRMLNRAFQKAVGAGKSIRAMTGIQNGIHSIGGAAALMARRIFGRGEGINILVVGAGQAAETVVRHLLAKDFDRIMVANRTWEKARELARSLGGEAVPYEDLHRKLAEADLVVFSAASPEVLISARDLRPLVSGRRRPLFLLDLGLPRNAAADCGRVEGVYLYDLDDLRRMVRESLQRKSVEKEQAEALSGAAASECCEVLDAPPRTAAVALAAGGRR